MQKTLGLLKTHKCLIHHEILDLNQGSDFNYVKVKATLIDHSQLFIREYFSSDIHIYSYHWQDKNGKLLIRWDNAPHHKNLKTFPHHKHTPNLEESHETDLEDVLELLYKRISKEKLIAGIE